MIPLADKIVAIERALRSADIPHAFGGALALAFHIEEPRGTRDIDVNIFLPRTRVSEVFAQLPPEIGHDERARRLVIEQGQVRLFWDENPVDLFFNTHAFHDAAAAHVVDVPFTGELIPVLGATELTVFKAFYDRTKDWADIEAMLDAGTVDRHRVLGWLTDLLGPDDERVSRFRGLLDRQPPAAEPRFDPV